MVLHKGGVEDTRLEAKAKDTHKKIRSQGQEPTFRGQTPIEAKDKDARGLDQGHNEQVLSPSSKKVFMNLPRGRWRSPRRRKQKVMTFAHLEQIKK